MDTTKLIIMAGGASSRMKRSLETSELTPQTKKIASSAHKSLIPLGSKQKPLLFHLIQNAVNAGFKEVYLITSTENEAFKECVGSASKNNLFAGALVHYAIQHLLRSGFRTRNCISRMLPNLKAKRINGEGTRIGRRKIDD